jgi:hypothetical protein
MMKATFNRVGIWCCLAGGCLFQGCAIIPGLDPDLALRAGLTFGSDLAIFLLENLAAGL